MDSSDGTNEKLDSAHEQVASGAVVILIGSVTGIFLGFIARIIPARLLGPDQYGLLMLGWTVVATLGFVANLGFKDGITRHIPRMESEVDKQGVFVTALSITVPWSLVLAGGLFVFAKPIVLHVFNEPRLVGVIRIFALVLPFTTVRSMVVSLFRGYQRARERVLLENLINPGLRAVLVSAPILAGAAVIGAVAGWVLAMSLTAGIALYLVYRRTPVFSVSTGTLRHRELLMFSAPLMVSGVMGLVLNFGDNFLIGMFLTSADVGVYDATFMISGVILTGLSAFAYLFLPIFSKLHDEGKSDQMNQLYRVVTKWVVAVTLPIYLSFLLFPEAVLLLFFGSAYTSGALVLSILATGFFLNAAVGLCVQALVSLGATRFILIVNIVAAIVNVLLNVVLVPTFGIVGAAAASAVTFVGYNMAYISKLYLETEIIPLSTELIRPVSGTIGIGIGLRMAFGGDSTEAWFPLVFGIIIGGCYLLLYVTLGGVSEADIDLVNIIENKSGRDLTRLKELLRGSIL